MDDPIKDVINAFNEMPAQFRYPTMVTLAGVLAEELPKAKQAYDEEMGIKREMFVQWMRMITGEGDWYYD